MVMMATMMADDDVFDPQNGTEQYCQLQVYNANLFFCNANYVACMATNKINIINCKLAFEESQ